MSYAGMSQESQLPQKNNNNDNSNNNNNDKKKASKLHSRSCLNEWENKSLSLVCSKRRKNCEKALTEPQNLNMSYFYFCTKHSSACGEMCSSTALPQLKHVTGLKWSKICMSVP